MKHLLYTLAILLIAASCSNEETEQVMGQGKARLRFHVSTESPIVITRSTTREATAMVRWRSTQRKAVRNIR